MLKRSIIAFFLAFTYTLVLAHSIVPHHHHEPADGYYQHLADAEHLHGGAQQENSIVHLLAHFPHNADASDLAVCQISNSNILVKKSMGTQAFLPPVFNMPPLQVFASVFAHDTPYREHISCYTGNSSSLRAPPIQLS